MGRYELSRAGRRVRLEHRPMELLLLLVERRGNLVAREEIVERLWGKDLFVDTENNINAAVRKIRQALRDKPDRPVFLRTVTGKGYCFIAPVTEANGAAESDHTLSPVAESERPLGNPITGEPPANSPAPQRRRPLKLWILALAVSSGMIALITAYFLRQPDKRVTIAVLPFDNLTGDPGQDYFSDGLTEETISALGGASPENLTVIGRTSSMRYKNTTKPIPQIGRELGADYLLEGSVRKEGGQVRVISKLIRVEDQSQVWSETYDRPVAGIITIHDEIGYAIAREVTAGISPRSVSTQRPPSPESYDLYLQGKFYWNQRTSSAVRTSIDYLKLATVRDPQNARAYAHLAVAYAGQPMNSDAVPLEAWRKARSAADEAMRLNASLAETHAAAGYLDYFLEWDWRRAERSLRRAIELNPSYDFPHVILARILTRTGRHAESAAEMEVARRLDPLSPSVYALAGQLLFESGSYSEAAAAAQRALRLNPDFWIAHTVLGMVYEQMGQMPEALRELELAFQTSEGNTFPLGSKGYVLARSGRRAEALDLIQSMKEAAKDKFLPPYNVALIYAGLGDRDAVWEWLNRAYETRDVRLVYLPVDPKWKELRLLPQFRELLRRCGFIASV